MKSLSGSNAPAKRVLRLKSTPVTRLEVNHVRIPALKLFTIRGRPRRPSTEYRSRSLLNIIPEDRAGEYLAEREPPSPPRRNANVNFDWMAFAKKHRARLNETLN